MPLRFPFTNTQNPGTIAEAKTLITWRLSLGLSHTTQPIWFAQPSKRGI